MRRTTVLSRTVSVFSLAAIAAFPFTAMANLDRENAEQVEDVTVSAPGIQLNHVNLKIINNAKSALAAVIGPTNSSMKVNMYGSVKCHKKSSFQSSFMHFGIAHRTTNSGLNESKSLHKAGFGTAVTQYMGVGPGWITEGAPESDFTIPLNKIKNGPSDVAFDPVAEFNKKMDAFVDGGGTKAEFLRKDRSFSVSRPITLAAMCRQKSHPFVGGWGTHTINVSLSVNYKGDPNIQGGVQPMAQNNQVQAPFMVESAQAVSLKNKPAFSGPSKMKFRVTIKASGKGQVKFRLIDEKGAKSPIRVMNFNNDGTKYWNFEKDVCQASQSIGGIKANNQQQQQVGGFKANTPGGHSWRVQVITPSAKIHPVKAYSWTCLNPKLGGNNLNVKQPAPPKTRLKLQAN